MLPVVGRRIVVQTPFLSTRKTTLTDQPNPDPQPMFCCPCSAQILPATPSSKYLFIENSYCFVCF